MHPNFFNQKRERNKKMNILLPKKSKGKRLTPFKNDIDVAVGFYKKVSRYSTHDIVLPESINLVVNMCLEIEGYDLRNKNEYITFESERREKFYKEIIKSIEFIDYINNIVKRNRKDFLHYDVSNFVDFKPNEITVANKEIFEKVIELGIDDRFGFKEFIAKFLNKEPILLIKRWEKLSKDRFGCVILNQKLLM